MSSREPSRSVATPALETIRDEVRELADPAGAFVVRCGRTGERPVPVDGLRFPDRENAARAAALTTEYRTRLRFWDDRTRYCDPIAHEESPGGEWHARDASAGDHASSVDRFPASLVDRVRSESSSDGDDDA